MGDEIFMTYEWHRRAQNAISQASITNSKRPDCFIFGVYPTHVTRGEGCFLYDTNNKKYIDYICGLGTNLLGYANPVITKAISDQMALGSLFSLSSTTEVLAAERLKDKIGFIKKVRFFKTGTEACMASIRIACAHTERSKILSDGYHGWSDTFLSLQPPHLGVPEFSHISKLTDLAQITTEIACVIVEPVITDYSLERLQYLQQLKAKCKSTGTLLIFDEIITGFRFPKWTFSQWSGITPDIICLGKAIANGMPLAVVGLGEGIGDNKEWFASGSYCGETLSLASMMKVIELLNNTYSLDDLWKAGESFQKSFNEIWPEKVRIEGYPTRGVFVGDEVAKALLWQECCRAGILFGSSFFYNFRHMDFNDLILNSIRDVVTKIKSGAVRLEGTLPKKPFAQTIREGK